MSDQPIKPHNFWYAVNNTETVVMPSSHLETFGTTVLHYHLVSELMDVVDRIRVREGTIQSARPQIITPTYYESEATEGFGDEAREYIAWLRAHAKDLRILQYGFKVEKKEIGEQVVSGNVREVLERVKQHTQAKNDPLSGVILGVDDPWDVCLLKFMVDVVRQSAPININELGSRNLLKDDADTPRALRQSIEHAFLQAGRDPALIQALGAQLRRAGLFEEYEDRFFALIQQSKKKKPL